MPKDGLNRSVDGVSRRSALLAGAGLAALPLFGCAAAKPPPPPRLTPVGNRNNLFWTPFSGATYGECQSRIRHVNGAVGVSDLRLRFVGWALDSQSNTSAEVDAPNDLEVLASLEYPEGTFHRMTFLGADAGTVRAGETIETDILPLNLPAGAVFHVRCLARAGAGGRYPFGTLCKLGLDRYESGPSGALSDKVMGGDIGTGGHWGVYTASAILGVAERLAHGVVIFGDSITYGFDNGLTEDSARGGDADGRRGWLERSLGSLGVGSLNLSAPGFTAFQPATDLALLTRRLALVADVGDLVVNSLGHNDWAGHWKTDTELMQAQAVLEQAFAADGLKTVFVTNLPWTDPDNTKSGGDPATQAVWRERYNAALRADAATHPVIDVASFAERGGLWADKGWRRDGTHPTSEGHAAIAAAVAPQLQAVLKATPLAAPSPVQR